MVRDCLDVIDSGIQLAVKHMERDAELLQGLKPDSKPCIHHYEWLGESLTYGYFCQLNQLLHLDLAQQENIQMARRPTGGGLLFHLSDLAFSVLVPASHPWCSVNPLQNYAAINAVVLQVVEKWSGSHAAVHLATDAASGARQGPFCMAQTTRYDLVRNGRKIGGAAQRRTAQGLLHQASLHLANPPFDRIRRLLRNGDAVVSAMQATSEPLLDSTKDLSAARCELRELLNQAFFSAVS